MGVLGLPVVCLLGPALCQAYAHYGQPQPAFDFDQAVQAHSPRTLPAPGKEGVMLMNRIGPSSSQLYIADADGANERLLLGKQSVFEYHASFSLDGKYISFTSERNGDGNSDAYMVRADGTGLEPIATTSSVEDTVSISPDGKSAVYASTRGVWTSNIWITDLKTKESRSLTNQTGVTGAPESPNGFFAPSWSPDGKSIVFSSDRNTAWTNHDNAIGWEHTQNLSIYTIKPDGTGFRKVYSEPGYSLGSPRFSPDGKRVVFYHMTLQNTWDARSSFVVNNTVNQIVSVDFATGTNRVQHTNSTGCKISPQFVTNDNVGYLVKGGPDAGIRYTSGAAGIPGAMRSPSWSPDGKTVVYEKQSYTTRPLQKKLWSWDSEWEYRFTDVFPDLSRQGKLTYTSKQTNDSSIVVANPDGSDSKTVFDVFSTGQLDPVAVASGGAGAFQPSWSYDGKWITFGLGSWFQSRYSSKAWIYRVAANGSYYEQLTNGSTNAGFPSYSPDGSKIVYRVFLPEMGLRVLDLKTRSTSVLTTERDNLPWYSPNGEWVLFTRNVTNPAKKEFSNYEICTVRPDGTDLKVLTSSYANDAHAVWTADGRIMWSSGMWGFQAEAATYDGLFQPYGQIMIMNADGSNKRVLTDSIWEDSMPLYLPNKVLI